MRHHFQTTLVLDGFRARQIPDSVETKLPWTKPRGRAELRHWSTLLSKMSDALNGASFSSETDIRKETRASERPRPVRRERCFILLLARRSSGEFSDHAAACKHPFRNDYTDIRSERFEKSAEHSSELATPIVIAEVRSSVVIFHSFRFLSFKIFLVAVIALIAICIRLYIYTLHFISRSIRTAGDRVAGNYTHVELIDGPITTLR